MNKDSHLTDDSLHLFRFGCESEKSLKLEIYYVKLFHVPVMDRKV